MTPHEINIWRNEIENLLKQKGTTLETVILPVIQQRIKEDKAPFKLERNVLGEWKLIEVGDSTEAWLSRFITQDPDMLMMKEDVKLLAQINDDSSQLFCVLIYGETGTGKEIIARALHGDRTSKFIAINCAGLPIELLESEMFGHIKGSFTGAIKDKKGIMSEAGTLFLDEISELPLQSQAKLLRAIQEKEIRKVGSEVTESINCRIVCATNKRLLEESSFRTDLYARISTFEIDTKPLSRRTEDITLIIKSMDGGSKYLDAVKEFENQNEKDYGFDITLNVRSLQKQVKRYKVLGKI